MRTDKRQRKHKIIWGIWIIFLITLIVIAILNHLKTLPKGLSFEGKVHYTDNVEFLYDLTYENLAGDMMIEQEIFDEAFKIIAEAQDFIIVDMFLFNAYTDQERDFPDLSGKLTKALIKQKHRHPSMQIVFITDPINTGYYSYKEKHIEMLRENDIEVVVANLSKLRDSNKAYSAVWRLLFQYLGQEGTGWLPNPFAKEAPSFTIRSYMELLNVKANHRKGLITENNALVTSANPHNESGFASNIGFKVSGSILSDMVKAEQAVIDYSGGTTKLPVERTTSKGNIAIQYLTEGKILKHILQEINQAKKGDIIWLGMFYLADRDVIEALQQAAGHGVSIRLILDQNKVAFGNDKTGLPNLPVASELIKEDNITIRWYSAEQDQYHTKLLYIKKPTRSVLIGGSANLTTRNLADLNLENDLKIIAAPDQQVMLDADHYFQRLWNNEDGLFTSPYETNEAALTPYLKMIYWIQKVTALTTY